MKNQRLDIHLLFILSIVFTSTMAIAKDYVIYSMAHDLPMGNKDEVLRKNYYINMGKNQGIGPGSILDVHRTLSLHNPYEDKERINHSFKIGEVKVIHVEDSSCVAILQKLSEPGQTPIIELGQMAIGDTVVVPVTTR